MCGHMDKNAKNIIRAMISTGKGAEYICAFDRAWAGYCDSVIDDFAESISMKTEAVRTAVRFLNSSGYLEYQTANGRPVGFHLSHKGLNWKYYRRCEILDYIADKWVDFFSALIAFASLIISVIALYQSAK